MQCALIEAGVTGGGAARSPVCFDEAKNSELVLFACTHIVCRGCYARLIRGPPAGANCAQPSCKP